MPKYDVFSICNALVDILIQVEDSDIKALGLTKGVMHLVDANRQKEVLNKFKDHQNVTELGGSAMNAIRTLSQLGLRTQFAGMIGDDLYGSVIKSRMEELGIAASLQHGADITGTCLILITPDGERTMNTNLGASRLYNINLVPENDIANSRVFHICGYQWDTDNQIETMERSIAIAKKNHVLVSFDVADPFVIGRHKDTFLALIKEHADIVFANAEEAKMLYGCTADEAASKVAETGAIAVIKKGAQGAVVGKGSELFQIKPVSTSVIDTTAAGDMFAAGFLFGHLTGKNLAESGNIAAILASDVISRIGASVHLDAIHRAKSV